MDSFIASKHSVIKETSEELLRNGSTILKEGTSKVHQKATEKAGFDFLKFAEAFKEEMKKDMLSQSKKQSSR
jgi:hypothetical protein